MELMETYINLLRSVSYFKNFELSDLRRIINSGHLKRYQKDNIVYHETAPSAGMFVLFSGKVQLCNYSGEGQVQIVSAIEPVTMFNELTAIDGGPNPTTAIVVQDCLTWNIGHEAFERLVMHYPDPALGLAMMRVMARRTRELIGRCEDLSFKPVLSRTVKLILELSDLGERPIDRNTYSLEKLAARISTVPVVVSRTINSLDKRGLISCDRYRIEILKPEELSKMVS